MAEHVTILGDGAMGTVCAMLLVQGGHGVTMWGAFERSIERLMQNRENPKLLPGVKIPEKVRLTAQDKAAFEGSTLVLSAVPTQYMRGAWERLRAYVPKGVPIVSVSKGIELSTLLRPTQIIADVLGGRVGYDKHPECDWPLAALSGPNIAAELARYLPASAVVAAIDQPLAVRVQQAFSTQWFRVYTSSDVIGVEFSSAAKNVIALAAGMIDGLGAGNNLKAALVTRGLVEITRLGVALGAKPETFMGLAGLGDLITTCVSPQGRNRSVGEQIGKGKKLAEILAASPSVAEGVPTTTAILELAARLNVEMPITAAVRNVLVDGAEPIAALTKLMSRDPKAEVPH